MAHGAGSTEGIYSETGLRAKCRRRQEIPVFLSSFWVWGCFIFVLCFVFKTGSRHVALAGLELTMWTGFYFFFPVLPLNCGGPMVINV